VSPQWYKPKGVLKTAFGNAFSEDEFIAFLQNDNIAADTKKYMIGRVKKLVKGNDILTRRIDDDIRWYAKDDVDLNPIDAVIKSVHTYMVQDKAITGLTARMKAAGISGGPETSKELSLNQDFWDNLNEKAEKKGEKIASNNKLGMYDKVYKKKYKSMLNGGDVKDPEYKPDSIEEKDLESFLQICNQEKVQPLVIVLPFNGYWYDTIGYNTDRRTAIYKAVDTMCTKYQATFVDLSAHEYDKYYFNQYPKRKVPPIKNPIPPSLNQWMIMKRPAMNNEKQKWKEFIVWLINKYNLQNQHIDNATITFTYYFKTKIRHDADNYTPKNIMDGFTESGLLLDDDLEHIEMLSIKGGYDKNNPRVEILIES
jgi:hypothetical protein